VLAASVANVGQQPLDFFLLRRPEWQLREATEAAIVAIEIASVLDTADSQFSSDTLNAVSPATNSMIEVEYPISSANYAFQAPSSWGNRRAEGSLQTDIRQLVLAQT